MESAVAQPERKTGRHPHVGNLATLDVDAAIDEIASGVLSKQIAARYSVNPKTLRDYLKRHAPEAYAAAVIDQAESMVEDATEYAMECSDKDDAPIARVKFDAAHKWAAARDAANWGHKSHVTVDSRIQVDVVLSDDAGDLLRHIRSKTVASQSHDNGALRITDVMSNACSGENATVSEGEPLREQGDATGDIAP